MIFCFSGTGNSLLVAEELSKLLGDSVTRICSATPRRFALADNERVVWVFPVYSWGLPPYVRRFIRSVEIEGGKRHYMVCTCGDDVGLAYRMWRSEIRRRGWRDTATYSVTMPNNYVCLPGFNVDPQALKSMKLSDAPRRIAAVARAIRHEARVDDVVRGKYAWLKSRIIYPWFIRFEMSPKRFTFTDACISCGKCARACPSDNISMTDGHPRWGSDCAFCLGCYHICPVHAVRYARRTLNKGQYFAPAHFPDRPNDMTPKYIDESSHDR